jgi:hypothetical protein
MHDDQSVSIVSTTLFKWLKAVHFESTVSVGERDTQPRGQAPSDMETAPVSRNIRPCEIDVLNSRKRGCQFCRNEMTPPTSDKSFIRTGRELSLFVDLPSGAT